MNAADQLEGPYRAQLAVYQAAVKRRDESPRTDASEREFHDVQNEFVRIRDLYAAAGGKVEP